MQLINRDELKEKLDRHDDFKLVMTLNEWTYQAQHIPGSINIFATDQIEEKLDPGDEIVVYCSNEACVASRFAFEALEKAGFEHVRRYAGGLEDWATAGYPLSSSAEEVQA